MITKANDNNKNTVSPQPFSLEFNSPFKTNHLICKGSSFPSFIHCGVKTYEKNELHVRRTLPTFNLQICEFGSMGLCEDGKSHMIESGTYFIMQPNMLHYGIPSTTRPQISRLHYIHFMPIEQWRVESSNNSNNLFRIQMLDDGNGIYLPSFLVNIPLHGSISKSLMEKVYNLTRNYSNLTYLQSQQQFLELLQGLIEENSTNSSTSYQDKTIISYIKGHYLDPDLSLDILSKRFGYSRQYITKKIKLECNLSYMELVTKLKLEYAKKELSIGYQSIGQLAQVLGYKDIAAFSNMFYKETGTRPSKYSTLRNSRL